MRKLLLTLMVVLVALVAFSQIVLTVAAGAVGQELELTKQAAEAYMSIHPDITVKVLDTPDMVQDRLGLYLQFPAQEPVSKASQGLPLLYQERV